MIDWTEVNALATVALVLTSAGAIVYASQQLAGERHYRAATNLEQQWGLFRSESFIAIRRKLAQERLAGSSLAPLDVDTPPASAFEVLDFYEHLALLEKRGHLDLYDIWHTFYEWLLPTYTDLLPIMEDDTSRWRTHYTDLRRLMARLNALQRKKAARRRMGRTQSLAPTAEKLVEHYRYEMDAGGGRTRRT